VEAGRRKLLSMNIKKKSPLLTRKAAPGKGKENKHSEVDGNKGIASFPSESVRLHMSMYPVREWSDQDDVEV